MNKIFLFIAAVFITVHAWEPLFDTAYQKVYIGGVEFKDLPIDLYGNGRFVSDAAPMVTDYDDDGLWDVVYGLYDKGTIIWTKNTGEIGTPKFDTFEFLKCDNDSSFVSPL